MEKTALILIDIQNIYFTNGSYLLFEPEKAADSARQVLQYFRDHHMPVIHIQNNFGTGGYIESKEFLNDFYSDVAPVSGEKIVQKNYPSAFLKTDLQEYLEGLTIKNLVVVGMMSHMCVDTTVRVSQNYGYEVTLIDDACTTKDLCWKDKLIPASEVHKTYMASLNGVFARVISLEKFLAENR